MGSARAEAIRHAMGWPEPRIWTFDLDLPRPLPGHSSNDRVHWSTKAASTATVRLLTLAGARASGIPTLERCRVDVTWIVNDRRRRDTDNLAPLLKAIYDGLGADQGVSARIVPDDTPDYMDKPGARIVCDVLQPPHFTVTITELEPDL